MQRHRESVREISSGKLGGKERTAWLLSGQAVRSVDLGPCLMISLETGSHSRKIFPSYARHVCAALEGYDEVR